MANIKQCDKCGKLIYPKENFFYNCKIQYSRNADILDCNNGEKKIDLCPSCMKDFRGFLGLHTPDIDKKEGVKNGG